MKALTLALLTVGLFAFTEATAQQTEEGKSYDKAFTKMDSDSDNGISLAEFKAFKEARAAKRADAGKGQGKQKKEKDPSKTFAKIDKNNDGSIDLAEFNAHKAKQKARKGKRRGAGKGRGRGGNG